MAGKQEGGHSCPPIKTHGGLENPPSFAGDGQGGQGVERDSGEDRGMSDWSIKQVKDLGEIITGRTPSTARKDFYDGDYNLISPADLDN